jgi:uncharacterized protein (DUF1697 family)
MPVYIAMLRGINVTGSKIIKMEALRASFAALGFKNVKSYVQSGNLIFEAPIASIATLSEKIEKKIMSEFGHTVPVFLRTPKEMAEIIKRNPLPKDPAIDQSKLHVTFLADVAPKNAADLLQPLAAGPEQIRVIGREICLYCPLGYGTSKISNNAIEKKLSIAATTRNWKTTNTLLTMAQ